MSRTSGLRYLLSALVLGWPACAESHRAGTDAALPADAASSIGDGSGAPSDAHDSVMPRAAVAGGRVVAWGSTDLVDAFVFEAGIVLVHTDGVQLVARDGAELLRWEAPHLIGSWWASDDAIAVAFDPGIPGEPAQVVVLTPTLTEVFRCALHRRIEAIRLDGEWLLVMEYLNDVEVFRVPEPTAVFRGRSGIAGPLLAASVGGEFVAAEVQHGATGPRYVYDGVGLVRPEETGLVGVASANGTVDDWPHEAPPATLGFSGPTPRHVLVANGDLFAIDLDGCRARLANCLNFLGPRGPLGVLDMGPARSGEGSTLFALTTGRSEMPAGAMRCDPADVRPVLGAPRCRLVRIDPDRTAPVWSVDWNRPVISVVAVEHDPWGNAVLVASYAEWAGSDVPRGWAIEMVQLP